VATKTNFLHWFALECQKGSLSIEEYFSLDLAPELIILPIMGLSDRVKKTIERNKLIAVGDSILVALSGGPDSVALLHLLTILKQDYELHLHALYINHRIRVRAAFKEEKFCRRLCQKLSVNFETISGNIPALSKRMKKGMEETARDFRYEQFERISKRLKCSKVALGHHVDDRIETILFRVFRGTGRTGLQGIPVKRGKYIRPLYDVSKHEILKYLKENKVKYCVDQSNVSIEYNRNFIRNKLLPQIRKRINADVDSAILNLVETISEEERFLEEMVDKGYRQCVSFTSAGKMVVALKPFNDYHLWLRRRLIRRCITTVSGLRNSPDKETVERVLEVAGGEKRSVSIAPHIQCHRQAEKLFIARLEKLHFSKELALDGTTVISELGFKFRTKILANEKVIVRKVRQSSKVIVDFDKLTPPLWVRSIESGDRFRPLGLRGTKKIGDYLTDRKVITLVRDEIPVIADAHGIIWLAGYEIAERVKIDSKTKKVLKIEFAGVN